MIPVELVSAVVLALVAAIGILWKALVDERNKRDRDNRRLIDRGVELALLPRMASDPPPASLPPPAEKWDDKSGLNLLALEQESLDRRLRAYVHALNERDRTPVEVPRPRMKSVRRGDD